MCRTAGGEMLDTTPFEDLLTRQMKLEDDEAKAAAAAAVASTSRRSAPDGVRGSGGLVMETISGRLRRGGLTKREYILGCNSHLVNDPLPGTHVVYTGNAPK